MDITKEVSRSETEYRKIAKRIAKGDDGIRFVANDRGGFRVERRYHTNKRTGRESWVGLRTNCNVLWNDFYRYGY